MRDWQQPGYGEIVCHCEMVTRREIEAAFTSPLPPGDFGGLRRRTRAAKEREPALCFRELTLRHLLDVGVAHAEYAYERVVEHARAIGRHRSDPECASADSHVNLEPFRWGVVAHAPGRDHFWAAVPLQS